MSNSTDCLFIVGCGRSGTTFLSTLLRNTKYGEPVESHFIVKYLNKINKYGDLNIYKNFKCLLNDILKEWAVAQWKLNIDTEKLFNSINDKSYSNIVNEIYSIRNKSKSKNWGDKTPTYMLHIETLSKLFPKSKFIYIVRDGRDVAMSLMKKEWGPSNIYTCAQLWTQYNQNFKVIKELEQTDRLLTINYEKLLDEFSCTIKDVFNFIDEPISDSEIESLSSERIPQNHGKWKKSLSAKQIHVFESVANSTLTRLGYECDNSDFLNLSFKKPFYVIHNAFKKVIYFAKWNIFDNFAIRFLGKQPFAN